jgi:hypothetical protein
MTYAYRDYGKSDFTTMVCSFVTENIGNHYSDNRGRSGNIVGAVPYEGKSTSFYSALMNSELLIKEGKDFYVIPLPWAIHVEKPKLSERDRKSLEERTSIPLSIPKEIRELSPSELRNAIGW